MPSPRTAQLSGQQLVETFMEELRNRLQQEKGREIEGSKRDIVTRVVQGSARLSNCNIDNLCRQLLLALQAPCHGRHGISYRSLGRDRFSVALT